MNRRPPAGRGGLVAAIALGTGALGAGVALTATSGWLIVSAAAHPPVLALLTAIVSVRCFGLLRAGLRYAERLVGHRAAFALLADARVRTYTALIPLTPARLGGRRRADVLAAVVDDVDAELDRQLRVIAPAAVALLVAGAAVGVQWAIRPAAGAVLVVVLVADAAIGGLALRAARVAEPQFVAARAAVSAGAADLLARSAEIISAGREAAALDEVAAAEGDLARAARRAARTGGLGAGLLVLTTGVAVAATALVAGPAFAAGHIDAPALAVLLLIPLALADVLAPLPDAAAAVVRVAAARARMTSVLAAPPAVGAPARPLPRPSGPGHLRLEGVRTRWSADGRDVLTDVSLDLPPGRRVAIIGPSGCGKSTLVAVLLRFLDPSGGQYLVDGVDATALDPDALREIVGLVDDAPHVFATTLAENVRLARPEADDAAVAAALRAARLGPWLDGLPLGLATPLGDGAAGISGGQRARLAFARVLLAAKPVLVLDEPTAHLDAATAGELISDVLDAGRGHTVVLVTHRREGLELVDEVIDLTRTVDLRP